MQPGAIAPLLAAVTAGRVLSPRACAFSDGLTLEDLRRDQAAFVEERDWAQFHTPRSLALALVGEVGEVCELLQWRGDEGAPPGLPEWAPQERAALADELADVLSYVVRLADVAGVDLADAFVRKLEKNRAKYPADAVRGSAAKYTEYRFNQRASTPAPQETSEGASSESPGGTGEWGTPDWVAAAAARASARVYGAPSVDDSAPPPPPPTTTTTKAETAAAPAERPNPRERAAAKVAELLATQSEEQPATDYLRKASADASPTADGCRPPAAQGGVEVENLDDLWGFMEYGDGPGGDGGV